MLDKEKIVYFITGDDKGRSKVRRFTVLEETKTKYKCRHKNFMKNKEGQGWGRFDDWKTFTTNRNNVKDLRIEHLKGSREQAQGLIEFIDDSINRDYKTFITNKGIPDPDRGIYKKYRAQREYDINVLQKRINRINQSIKDLENNKEEK